MSSLLFAIDELDASTCVVFIKGTADMASHDEFQEEMKSVLNFPRKNVILDIRELEFLTSLAVGEMLALSKARKAVGGRVVIAGPNEYVKGVFAASRLGSVITIVPTVDAAAHELKAKATSSQ